MERFFPAMVAALAQFVGILANFTQRRDALAGKEGKPSTIFPWRGMVHKGRVADSSG
jgi:hypothetical protein